MERISFNLDRGNVTRAIARERVGIVPGRRVMISKKAKQDRKRIKVALDD